MLKSTFSPIFSTDFLTRTKFSRTSKEIVSVLRKQSAQTVRQNATTTIDKNTELHKLPPTSAYVHLPFCRKRCHYCDFPIIALGLGSSSSLQQSLEPDPRMVNYIQTLCREINATPSFLDHLDLPLETVFFGGGTPSLVSPGLVSQVLESLSSKFGVCLDAEISMEMDPGTFDAEKMKEMMKLGVNRVSLGVQAFQEDLLRACGRAHGVNEVYEALEILKSCQVDNWSMDIISSLPHQTSQMWEETLKLTIQAQPPHISVYDLQVEQDTKFGLLYVPGESPLPSEDQSAEFYKMASRMLTDAGYVHYEISSYCKSGYECKHNLTYWKNKPFYGFGLGSASYVNGVRFSRPRKLKDFTNYVQNLEDGETDDKKCNLDPKDLAADIVMLSLRTSRGLDLKSFSQTFGSELAFSLCKAYETYAQSGHVMFLDEQRRTIEAEDFTSLLSDDCKMRKAVAFVRLSDPDGFLLSNDLISHAFGVLGS